MPRRLLLMGEWPWTDYRPGQHRVITFCHSAEALTTVFLIGYAIVFVWPGSTFVSSSAFDWIRGLVDHRPGVWGALAIALAITGPVALAMDSGTLRLLSMISQGIFFLFLANSVRLGAPPSLLFGTLVISGCWLVVRAGALARYHWRGGRGDAA